MQKHITTTSHIQPTRTAALIGGVLLGLLAIATPMEMLGMDHMFTVHMVQHLLLSLIVSPLLLLSISPSWLQEIFKRHPGFARVMGYLTMPVVASLLFNANIWLWHAPPLLNAMMSNAGLHLFINLLYIATGLLFWWPLVNPLQDEQRTLPLGGKLAYLFFSDMPMMLLGAGMTFAAPLYTISMADPMMNMRITAQDQQISGLLMWVAGSIYFIVIASILFLRWMLRQEQVQRTKEAAEWDEE